MINDLFDRLGTGVMRSVPYDTAWLARLSVTQPQYSAAYDWLRIHQNPDGSWGSRAQYFHDRFICTLSAVLALHESGTPDDLYRANLGVEYLWRECANLHADPHDTIAYAVLMTSLTTEATNRGLLVPRHLAHNPAEVTAKLRLLAGHSQRWRGLTMSFSLEILRDQVGSVIDFVEDNGSVGVSPGATAAILSRTTDPRALAYLDSVIARQGDGGLPNVSPIDVFETAWGLNYMRIAGVITPEDPRIQRHLDFLERNWHPEHGISHSSYFSVRDLDDTAITLTVLNWAGRVTDAAVFASYELEDGFRCYEHESLPSLSAQLHLLMCLRTMGYDRHHPWVIKAMNQVTRWKEKGEIWYDKWHASPYYLVVPMVEALIDLDPFMLEERIRWIMMTQRLNAGWGFYGHSTAEETAYALIALMRWSERYEGVPEEAIEAGIDFLRSVVGDDPTPLWIGKCLYAPHQVIEAAVGAALSLYDSRQVRRPRRRSARRAANGAAAD